MEVKSRGSRESTGQIAVGRGKKNDNYLQSNSVFIKLEILYFIFYFIDQSLLASLKVKLFIRGQRKYLQEGRLIEKLFITYIQFIINP